MLTELRIALLTVIQKMANCKLQFLLLLLSSGLFYQQCLFLLRYINNPTNLQTIVWYRGGGKVGKRAVEQNYASVLSELTLQLGSCHGLTYSGQHEPLRWPHFETVLLFLPISVLTELTLQFHLHVSIHICIACQLCLYLILFYI